MNRNIPMSIEVILAPGSSLDWMISDEVILAEIRKILSGQMPEGSLKVHWSNSLFILI